MKTLFLIAALILAYPAHAEEPIPPEKAEKIIEFHNRSHTALASGYYAIPDSLIDYVGKYRSDFRLPPHKLPSGKKAAQDKLMPARGLFTEQEAADLAKAQQDMDRTLAELLNDFHDLEAYINDPEIMDDGKKGEELSRKIISGHSQFIKARKSWLEIVEARAANAEKILLEEHPLRRQILCAHKILNQIRETELLINADSASALPELSRSVRELTRLAKTPPFQGAPQHERIFREFLKKVDSWRHILDRGLKEGLHTSQKREIAKAAKEAVTTYNAFARAMNSPGS